MGSLDSGQWSAAGNGTNATVAEQPKAVRRLIEMTAG